MTHGGDIFAIARARGWDWRDIADFSASINPLGPAPGVRRAICDAVDRIQHYPEREPVRVRDSLAQMWNVNPDQILLGNGGTELIFFLPRVLKGDHVSLAVPCFSEFHRAFPSAAAVELSDPETWPHSGVLAVTTPANPTGRTTDVPTLRRRLELSKDPVIVDESFLEFSGLPSAATLISEFPHLIVLRSLTKFYALPGLRLGALVSSESSVREWRLRREPWQVNVLAEEAALAALRDSGHAGATIQFVRSERDWLTTALQCMPGVTPHSSSANFLYVSLTYSAQDLTKHLLESKILVRNCSDWPGLTGEAVRIAVRTRRENERLLTSWRNFRCG